MGSDASVGGSIMLLKGGRSQNGLRRRRNGGVV